MKGPRMRPASTGHPIGLRSLEAMAEDCGRHLLTGLALAQIEQAENDPRAAKQVGLRNAFYAATGEAENLRFLAQLGLTNISRQLEHEHSADARSRQAKWAQ